MLCYSQLIPILGPTLSRLREYSCDWNGAALEPKGELGLILLTADRYAADNVQPASWSTKDATSAVSGWASPSCLDRIPGPCGGSGGCTSWACSAVPTPSTRRSALWTSRNPVACGRRYPDSPKLRESFICRPLPVCATPAPAVRDAPPGNADPNRPGPASFHRRGRSNGRMDPLTSATGSGDLIAVPSHGMLIGPIMIGKHTLSR